MGRPLRVRQTGSEDLTACGIWIEPTPQLILLGFVYVHLCVRSYRHDVFTESCRQILTVRHHLASWINTPASGTLHDEGYVGPCDVNATIVEDITDRSSDIRERKLMIGQVDRNLVENRLIGRARQLRHTGDRAQLSDGGRQVVVGCVGDRRLVSGGVPTMAGPGPLGETATLVGLSGSSTTPGPLSTAASVASGSMVFVARSSGSTTSGSRST